MIFTIINIIVISIMINIIIVIMINIIIVIVVMINNVIVYLQMMHMSIFIVYSLLIHQYKVRLISLIGSLASLSLLFQFSGMSSEACMVDGMVPIVNIFGRQVCMEN